MSAKIPNPMPNAIQMLGLVGSVSFQPSRPALAAPASLPAAAAGTVRFKPQLGQVTLEPANSGSTMSFMAHLEQWKRIMMGETIEAQDEAQAPAKPT